MPEVKAAGYASWDPRGFYHFHEYRGGPFISGWDYLSMLKTSTAGFHGEGGLLQPYGAVEQILGEGIPTPGHKWWRTLEEILTPTENVMPRGARQYITTVTFMTPEGEEIEHDFSTKIGEGYDVWEMEARIIQYERAEESPPLEEPRPRVSPEEEWLTEVERRTVQADWTRVGTPF